ncbi:MAG: LacI family transcriptional regulator [Flavobacterium sp.]|nr:LacI family transcriptional regulator [Flavobacterium sp.]
MTKKTTIYDIAKKLNLSAATVSRALNGNTRISEETRAKVLKVADSLNYEQNKLARALQSGKSYSVGVIVPRIDNNFLSSVIRGIEEELQDSGYHVIICQTHESPEREIENINTLLNAQVDGLLLSTCNVSDENFKLITKVINKNIPVVFFDRKIDVPEASSVTIDDYMGAYLATMHLIKEGATKIAHFSGDKNLQIYESRYKGYCDALKKSNIAYNEDYVIKVRSKIDDGKAALKQLFTLKDKPNALFSSSDFAALGAIQELKANKIDVPNEFSVFGFGNEPFTQFNELSISSVDQSPIKMGKLTATVFLEKIQNKLDKGTKNIVLEPELQYRASSNKKDNVTV